MATLILKVTEQCDSNCVYCDVVRKADNGRTMTLDTLSVLFARVNEFLSVRPEEVIEILWHGGEPLLVGPEYYYQAFGLLDRHCRDTRDRISHSIQTNLLCLTEDFFPVFDVLGITAVGTSYDPEPHIRGPGADIRSDIYNTRFFSSLGLLEQHGIGWGMIYVVTQRSLQDPRAVFFHLTNMLLSGGINFNPVLIYDPERKHIAISPEEFARFLGAIFPVWWEHRSRYPDVEPFRSFVRNIIDGHTSLACVDAGSCTYQHINVAPDGDTSQCGRSGDWGLLRYGNIHDRSLEQILAHPERDQLDRRITYLQGNDCAGCRFWKLCHGGCPLDAWSQHGEFMHRSEWCDVKRIFLEEYFEPVTGVRVPPPVPSDSVPIRSLTVETCLLYTSPSPRDRTRSRMPSSA